MTSTVDFLAFKSRSGKSSTSYLSSNVKSLIVFLSGLAEGSK